MTRALILGLILMSLLAACAEPAYTPDAATLAEREAQEYATSVARGAWMWRVFLGATIVMLSILTALVAFLAQVRYKVANYQALKLRGDARRSHLVSLGDGYVLDLHDDTIYSRYNSSTPAEVIPAPTAPPAPEYKPQSDGLQKFLIEAAGIVGWDSDTLPRWNRWAEKGYQMTGAEWMKHTDELAALELIVKAPGQATTIADGYDLRWIYDQLPHPTPKN